MKTDNKPSLFFTLFCVIIMLLTRTQVIRAKTTLNVCSWCIWFFFDCFLFNNDILFSY